MRKKISLFLLCVVGVLTLGSCSRAKCDAGFECVYVKKPMFFGRGGVAEKPLMEGSEWTVFTTEKVYIDMKPVKFTEALDDIASNNNTLLDFECNITLQIERGKSPLIVADFGADWYNRLIKEQYINSTRNYISQFSPFELMSNREVLAKIDSLIKRDVEGFIKQQAMPIKIISVVTGKAKPNKPQLDEMNVTAAQIQAKETQDRRQEMELSREKAERQRAIADKAYQTEMNLTAEQFIQLKAWDIIEKKQGANIDVLFNADKMDKMWNVRRN